jgi:hypothetical protein
VAELERGLASLRAEREEVARRLAAGGRRRGGGPGAGAPQHHPDAAPTGRGLDAAERAEAERERDEASALLERLDQQIEARARTIPIYVATLESDGLGAELRARRDHPLHGLLRRMYHEERAAEPSPE